MAAWRPEPVSPRPASMRMGGPSGDPVRAMTPLMAWAIISKSRYPAYGPSLAALTEARMMRGSASPAL
jgi:hypothetical protein